MAWLECLVFLSVLARAQSLQCRNAEGDPVDWFAMYKMPQIAKSRDSLVKEGLAVMYLDGKNPSWNQSAFPITDTRQALYQTLAQVYNNYLDNNMMYLMYNDKNITSSKYGHTKGVVAFNTQTGFWLVHSVPGFPPKPGQRYTWPNARPFYGQIFLCVTFPYRALGDIGEQLYYNYPDPYAKQVPPAFQTAFPRLRNVVRGEPPNSPPWFSVKYLTSLAGTPFRSIAKYTNFGADLYDGLIAPNLMSSLLVETWNHGRGGNLPDNCFGRYHVMNVEEVSIDGRRGRVTFGRGNDHAKWAVSAYEREGHWVCVGDINRQTSQFKRAGGAVCFNNPQVWKTFHDSVSAPTIDSESKRRRRSLSDDSSYSMSSSSSCPISSSYSSAPSSISLSFSSAVFPLIVAVVQVVRP